MAEKQTKKRASGSKLTGKSSGSRKSTSKGSKSKAKTQTPIRREVGAGSMEISGPAPSSLILT